MQFEAMQTHRTLGATTKKPAFDQHDEDVLNHNRKSPPMQDDDEYENDSELGDDLQIDDAGNVLGGSNNRLPRELMNSASSMAHILAGYGTDICEQLIAEFV